MPQEIHLKIAKLIAEQLNISEASVTMNASFDELGADSLDQIEILMKTEELFNIEISDEACEHVVSVKDLVDCVAKII